MNVRKLISNQIKERRKEKQEKSSQKKQKKKTQKIKFQACLRNFHKIHKFYD